MTERRRLAWIRRPVRRDAAERYLFLTLVSFAGTVLLTRWFLHLTGFPKLGGGDLHIAHALWGGLVLFAAAILPILLAGRFVYQLAAVLAGVGIGLFIDEVGKFITAQNDYFYPAAAPIIYATFLLAVLVWLRAAGPEAGDPRSHLLGALELLDESVEGDLQPRERDELLERLRAAASHRGASSGAWPRVLLEYVDSRSLEIAPPSPPPFSRTRAWWRARRERWIGGRGMRVVIVAALLVSGITAVLALPGVWRLPWTVQRRGAASSPSTRCTSRSRRRRACCWWRARRWWRSCGRHRLGWTLAYFGLLVILVLGDLISFYLRQFDSVGAVAPPRHPAGGRGRLPARARG